MKAAALSELFGEGDRGSGSVKERLNLFGCIGFADPAPAGLLKLSVLLLEKKPAAIEFAKKQFHNILLRSGPISDNAKVLFLLSTRATASTPSIASSRVSSLSLRPAANAGADPSLRMCPVFFFRACRGARLGAPRGRSSVLPDRAARDLLAAFSFFGAARVSREHFCREA